MHQFKIVKLLTALSLLGLTACGGSEQEQPQNTLFSLGVSDAPVTEAAAVVVCFSGIQLVGNNQPPQSFTLGSGNFTAETNDLCRNAAGNVIPNTRGIDLLQLQGATAEALITNATVAPGSYGQLRLDIAEGSYLERLDGSRHRIQVPSNQLRLNGPVLSGGGNFSYTLEFDLRKALVDPVGIPGYFVKPTGLRLVDNSEIGHLEGLVAEGFLLDNQCTVNPADERAAVAAVYMYEGADLPLAELSDNGGTNTYQPYASTAVFFNNDATEYQYAIGFVDAGSYTVAITCEANDDPENPDDISFIKAENVTIEARQQPHKLDFE
ncbi:hypothetical protein WG68_14340 [Arsukibacterium ikkense]|uniref:DUF4382 domain-containing protein n=1 Tax=Arsukibacterium ikkense TaxID=336831 RepID=A0A0M2V2V5_9GAMM|nr:DUF4382 domain-containing protein [Arsukibacterium ikkense]KKO44719.1 hypothetical protein WG68_14340 [Arsukibacterium ikkense]